MEVKTKDYSIDYNEALRIIALKGTFRLGGTLSGDPESYGSLVNILNSAAAPQPPLLTLDIRELDFLNSSGINVICKFVISVRQKGGTKLMVLGSRAIPWQGKSLQNLQKLMPSLELILA